MNTRPTNNTSISKPLESEFKGKHGKQYLPMRRVTCAAVQHQQQQSFNQMMTTK